MTFNYILGQARNVPHAKSVFHCGESDRPDHSSTVGNHGPHTSIEVLRGAAVSVPLFVMNLEAYTVISQALAISGLVSSYRVFCLL